MKPEGAKGNIGIGQFMHPCQEHPVRPDGWTPWNLRQHRRKFMKVHGNYVGETDQLIRSEVTLWGEWEPPSQLISSWESSESLPDHLVRPVYPGRARPTDGLQNTDPYIFGNCFKYTLCKQVRKNGTMTFLSRLSPGTVVLFGSHKNGNFVLDTVFVVDDQITRHSRHTWESAVGDKTQTYEDVTLRPTYGDPFLRDSTQLTLYRGVTYAPGTANPYSFVPCRDAGASEVRFSRPEIALPGVINRDLLMGQRFTRMSISEVRDCWMDIRAQVEQRGLSLGVSFDEPDFAAVPWIHWPSPHD